MPDGAPAAAPAAALAGTLVSWTVIRKPPAAFAGEPLYAIAVVDLPDGRRVTGRLDPFAPQPALGSPVRQTGEHGGVPVFGVVSDAQP